MATVRCSWLFLNIDFQNRFSFINAGISSTCSTTGAFRLHRDVLSHGPIDLFFIEFAVNDDQDANHTYDECILGMEGIIRQIRTLYPRVDIVVTYFVNPKMLAQLQEGKKPTAMAAHEEVLERYQVSGFILPENSPIKLTKENLVGKSLVEHIQNQLAIDCVQICTKSY